MAAVDLVALKTAFEALPFKEAGAWPDSVHVAASRACATSAPVLPRCAVQDSCHILDVLLAVPSLCCGSTVLVQAIVSHRSVRALTVRNLGMRCGCVLVSRTVSQSTPMRCLRR